MAVRERLVAADFEPAPITNRHCYALPPQNGETVFIPTYDFGTHKRLPETTTVEKAHVVIVDGIFTLHVDAVRYGARCCSAASCRSTPPLSTPTGRCAT